MNYLNKNIENRILILLLFFSNILNAQVTIENLLSVPFPTDLKSSSDGKHLAWVFNDKGIRNLFEAECVTNERINSSFQCFIKDEGGPLIYACGRSI